MAQISPIFIDDIAAESAVARARRRLLDMNIVIPEL